LHNTEFDYYHHLALHEKHPFRKFYFNYESRLLRKYEKKIALQAQIIAVSMQDAQLYKQFFGAKQISYLPVFLPYTEVAGNEGKGCYCLYHGNLAINENEEAATWLLQHVFVNLDIPFVIAGKNPSQRLIFLAKQSKHTCLVDSPDDKEMQDLVRKAQINILPSFNNTGVKLKLLNALFNGRHCIVNRAGVAGSGLDNLCHIAEDADGLQSLILKLYRQEYTQHENEERKDVLLKNYQVAGNAEKIISMLWD
jgi:hypothetical protein